MRAYVYTGKSVIKTEVPNPKIRPNDVLVEIDEVSICGSDFHIFANDDWAREMVSPGIVIGHEGSGKVIEVGNDVSDIDIGDAVALESHYACPHCEKEGKTADDCSHYGIIGVHGTRYEKKDHEIGGVFSELIAIPHYCCHKVSANIYAEVPLSLLEPGGNSWEIIRFLKKGLLPENIAIYGCGPHGLNIQLFSRYVGIKNIVAFETDPYRLDFAKKFASAHHVLNPYETTKKDIDALTNGKGFDTAVDMVGNINVVKACKENVKENGMVILFGLPGHEALIADGETFSEIIFSNEEHRIKHNGKNILLRGFTGRSQETWIELLNALESSQDLRTKLSQPLKLMGRFDDIESFIKKPPERFLKNGFQMKSVVS